MKSIVRIPRCHERIGRFVSMYSILTTIFVALILTSTTTSSLNITSLRENIEVSNGLLFGQPNPIRGDEFAKSTPITLSGLITGNNESLSPMDVSSGKTPTKMEIFVKNISFAPEKPLLLLAEFLPLPMGFSLVTWLGVWIFSMSFVYWGKRFQLKSSTIAVGLILSIFAPSSIWWSFWPIGNAAPLLASLAIIDGSLRLWEKRSYFAVPIGIAGVLELFAYSNLYFPWAITYTLILGIPLLLFSLSSISKTKRNIIFVSVNASFLLGLIAVQSYVISSKAATLLTTEYPGVRRFSDSPQQLGNFLDAPFSYVLQFYKSDLNGSELSSPWNILIFLAIMLKTKDPKSLSKKVFLTSSLVSITVLSLWALVPFPKSIENHLLFLPLVSPDRISAVIGIASMFYVMVKIQDYAQGTRPSQFSIFLKSFFVLLVVGSLVRSEGSIPISPKQIWVISFALALAFCLSFSTAKIGRISAMLLLILFIGISSKSVLPIQRGLGDLNGRVAIELQEINKTMIVDDAELLWAADTWELPSLLISNGIRVINGEQIFGPSEKWQILDPEKEFYDAYNRGASTVYINWANGDSPAVIESPQGDQIVINIGACNPRLRDLNVSRIISTRSLSGNCLEELTTFTWASTERFVYILK
jgi:hypothetical protein